MPVRGPRLSLAPPKYRQQNAWVRTARERVPGLTQKQVAHDLGCSCSHWNHVECGARFLSYDLHIKYSLYIDAKAEALAQATERAMRPRRAA